MRNATRKYAIMLLSLSAELVLSGCSRRARTMYIPDPIGGPGRTAGVATSWTVHASENFPCYVRPPSPQPFSISPHEAAVGYQNNHWTQDNFLFTCFQHVSRDFRGYVQFDLTGLQDVLARENLEVMFATLRFGVVEHETNAPEMYPHSCAATLSVATAPGREIGTPRNTIRELPDRLVDQSFSVEVTEALRDWVTGRLPNNGFTIDAGPVQAKEDFDFCMTYYDGFQLTVELRNRS